VIIIFKCVKIKEDTRLEAEKGIICFWEQIQKTEKEIGEYHPKSSKEEHRI